MKANKETILESFDSDLVEACNIPQDRYRVFIEEVADAFFETNLKGEFVFFNKALCRIFGYSAQEIQNRSYREFMDASNAEFAFERFNTIFRTGKGATGIKWEIIHKNGETRYLDISANTIADAEGKKVGFRGIARDITSRHLARRALQESEKRAQEQYRASRRAEKRYRAFLEFLPDPVFVFNLDSTVSYLNPAFERVFGWTLKELKGKRIPFIPEGWEEQTRQGIAKLLKDHVIYDFETKRLTRDGRVLDIILNGALFYDAQNQPAGQVITLRDVTQEKRTSRINQALFRIAQALYRFRTLDERLEYITKEIQSLVGAEGASVILIDEENEEFFFRVATFEDELAGQKMREIRFPLDKGVAGEVYRTGEPLIVHDTTVSPFFFQQVDQKAGYSTRNMLDVPLREEDRMIGVLCAVNKKDGTFDQTDVELLSTIASMVALPIENARINDALQRSYEDVQSLNRAKDHVIHHLSHELKTPVSVLSASLNLLSKKLDKASATGWQKIMDRAQRNLSRILDMQYQIEDIMRGGNYSRYYMLSNLLEACTDVLEVLATEVHGQEDIVDHIRERIEALFGPHDAVSEEIELDRFVAETVDKIQPDFAHRDIQIVNNLNPTPAILIPSSVLFKVVRGLVRNAIEYSPDGGRIEITVNNGLLGPELEIKDYGIGITEENQRLIFEDYFPTYDTIKYSSKKAFDFNAGGKGFDLLRMKIFSERYHFVLKMTSKRCRYLLNSETSGPGNIKFCEHCKHPQDCIDSGGTKMLVQFKPAAQMVGAT